MPLLRRDLQLGSRACLALLLTLLLACGIKGEDGEARVSESEPTMHAMENPTAPVETRASPRIGGPGATESGPTDRPLQVSQMGYNSGSGDAPVKVLEISDFGCGYCRRFHQEAFPRIREIYLDAGFVEWKFIPFVLGMFPNGLQAAIAGECAGEQEKFFPMQERLFAEQRGWRNSDDPYALFSTIAGEEGLDVERFDGCVTGGWREDRVRANIRLGQQAGARGTPMFLVDGRPVAGALPLEDFRRVLDAALLQRGITPPPT